MRSTAGVIALVPDHWSGIVTLRHQILGRLARRFPVVWVEPAFPWRDFLLPSGSRFLRGDKWHSPSPGLHVLTPGWRHPLVYRPQWLRTATLRSRLAAARRYLLDRGCRQIVLYVWRDEFADALDLVAHDLSCYHIDDEYSFSETDVPNSPRETRLIERASQVIVHSSALMRKKGAINPSTALIPNGVDFARFTASYSEPADLAPVPHPRIGYAGVIKKQLDLGLLLRLADARPQFSFVLVGPVGNVAGKEEQLAELRRRPNVHFLGAKSVDALPAYIRYFDVCVMLYEVTNYTDYIYPLKLHEYLASGRPTVASPIETVKAFAKVIDIASSDADWIGAIERCLGQDACTTAVIESRQACARDHDWEDLVERIAETFLRILSRRQV